MKPRSANLFLFTVLTISFTQSLQAADITKADNLDNLTLGSSWVGTIAPGINDVAVWNNTFTGTNSTLLGANASWSGIRIADPAGAVTIGSGSTLTLGSGGIQMGAATNNLIIGSGLTLLANTSQSWNVGTGRTLSITGALTTGGGGVAHVTNTGTINIASGTASSRLSSITLNGLDVAALDASKNLVNATSVFTYVNPAGGNSSGTVVGLDVQTTTTGSTQAYRHSNTLTVTNGVRFNAANTQNTSWTVDTSTSGRVGTLPHIIVTSNVGAQDIFYNGSGGIRAASSGGELFLHQLNTSGRLVFNTTINGNGASSLTKTGAGTVVIASASGYTGATRINEGTFQLGNGGATGSVGSTSIVNNGSLTFNRTDVLSAPYGISGSGSVTQLGSGTLSLTGSNTYTGATNFNAGTVSFTGLSNFGSGTALNFNGGALSWNGITTDISTRTVTINASGATFNTNGNNVSLANSIGNSGSGGLTKAGAGTLTLNGGSYGGATTVSGGTLVANGSFTGGAAISSGGTLGGTGTYGGTITVNNGGIIAPGNSVGTITTNALTLGSGSILNFEFNNTPGNDYINVTGSGGLTINGGGFNLYAEGTNNAFASVGSYNLIGYSGSISGTGAGALAVLNPQAGKNYGFSATGSNVVLDITNAGVISNWTADTDGSWNTSGNWSGAVPNGQGETGNFSQTLTAPRTVTLDGNKTLGGISFNGGAAPLGYTIAQGSSGSLALDNGLSQASLIVTSGDNAISADVSIDSATAVAAVDSGASLTVSGSIGGTGGLVKSGSGTLDLTNAANGYDGNTTVTGGTLGFAGIGGLGDGSLLLDGGTLRFNVGNTSDISAKTVSLGSNGGTLNTNANDVTLAAPIGNSGTGSLTKSGSGTLTLGGSNTYSGATIVNGGTLSISANNNLGPAATGASLTLNGGTLNNTAAVSLDNAGANARSVTIGASGGTVKTDATLTIAGQFTSSSSLTKTGTGTLQLNGNNSSTLGGSLTLAAGTVALGGGQANGMNAIGTASVVFQGGTLNLNGFGASDNATTYGTFSNPISVAAGQTGTLNLPKRLTVSSTLTGAGTLNVKLDGTRDEFQGNWGGFTGQINLTGPGEFRIQNFQTSVFGSSKLNLAAGVLVQQVFNPPGSGNFTTVQSIGELSGAAGSALGGNPVGGRFVEWSVGSLNTSSTFSGAIQNDTDSANGFGEAKFTKVGSGTLTLDGTSTYTGATTVTAGTLLVNGALGNSAVTVTGGTLGGTGTIGGAVTVNAAGKLSPGASIESLAVASATISGSLVIEYDGAAAGTIDLLAASGLLDITTATVDFDQFGSLLDDPSYIFASYGSLIGSAFATVLDLPTGYTIDYAYNDGITSNNIALVAIPEPSAAFLGGLGVFALLRRRRA